MKKLLKFIWCISAVIIFFFLGTILADKIKLRDNLIFVYVDADMKSVVCDMLRNKFEKSIKIIECVADGKSYLCANLENIGDEIMREIDSNDREVVVSVSFGKKNFMSQNYGEFCLPAGIYDTLTVDIDNITEPTFLCLVFPFCYMYSDGNAFATDVVKLGFDRSFADTLSRKKQYRFRFLLLDYLGKMEIILFSK